MQSKCRQHNIIMH